MAGEYGATRQLSIEGIVDVFRFVTPHPFVEMDVSRVISAGDFFMAVESDSDTCGLTSRRISTRLDRAR